MTDEQIIKALECCYIGLGNMCSKCPLSETDNEYCEHKLQKSATDLIKRQKSEIERLKKDLEQSEQSGDILETILGEKNANLSELFFKERDNAVREFADMLKQNADNYGSGDEFIAVSVIDDVVKDMTRSDDE